MKLNKKLMSFGIGFLSISALGTISNGDMYKESRRLEVVNIVDICAGDEHAGVTIDSDGNGSADQIWMWGNDTNEQLGVTIDGGSTFNPTLFDFENTNFSGSLEIKDLSLGLNYSGAIINGKFGAGTTKDWIYMWGNNTFYQLGSSIMDAPVQGMPSEVTSLSSGSQHSGVLVDENTDGKSDAIYTWGDNTFDQLGFEPTGEQSAAGGWLAQKVEFAAADQLSFSEIVDISMGGDNSGALVDTTGDTKADSLYMWGSNSQGQLGHEPGTNGDEDAGGNYGNSTPTKVEGLPEGGIKNVEIGNESVVISIDTTGDTKADSIYVLGYDSVNGTPTKVEGLPEGEVQSISAGGSHFGATIDTDGDTKADSVYMWGDNSYGQLGNESISGGNLLTPTKVEGLPEGETIIDLSLGKDYTMVSLDKTNDGKADSVYTWGINNFGQLGYEQNNGSTSPNSTPKMVDGLPTKKLNDYEIVDLESIEVNSDNSTIIINNKIEYYGDDTEDERKAMVNIIGDDGFEHNLETTLDEQTGQIIINNQSGTFIPDVTYTVNSIKYNYFEGDYLYTFTPTSNNSFVIDSVVNPPNPKEPTSSLLWLWILISIIILILILLMILIVYFVNKSKKEKIVEENN